MPPPTDLPPCDGCITLTWCERFGGCLAAHDAAQDWPVISAPSSLAQPQEIWGVIGPRGVPCLFGTQNDAEEGVDSDERVALFRVQEVPSETTTDD